MLLLALLSAPALAAEAEFVGTADPQEAVDEPVASLTAEAGGSWTAGNTDTRMITGRLDGSYRWNKNQVSSEAQVVSGSSLLDSNGDGRLDDDERAAERVGTAKRYQGLVRYDRFLAEKSSIYVLGGGFSDQFAGYDYRINGQLGYSFAPIDSEHTLLVTELGFDVANENYTEDVELEDQMKYSGRVLVSLAQDLGERSQLTTSVETFVNVINPSDTRVLGNATLSNKLTEGLSLNLSYGIIYDHEPVPDFAPMDHMGTVTLVASIF